MLGFFAFLFKTSSVYLNILFNGIKKPGPLVKEYILHHDYDKVTPFPSLDNATFNYSRNLLNDKDTGTY